MKRVALIAALSAALVLAGCAVAPERSAPAVPAQLFEDSAFAPPTQLVDAAQALALSPQMRRYLEVAVAPRVRRLGRQEGLVDALVRNAQLSLEYDTDYTRTAAEAFDARSGNCLSLVLMTAALAKALDLRVTYQVLVGEEVWARSGDLSLAVGHVNILVEKRLVDRVQGRAADTQLELSFGASPFGRGSMMRPVAEQTIVAMFMNNRAGESLARGDLANAYAYAREAIVHDPRFAGAYNTLGVVYQRRGMAAHAERAYAHSLDVDPNSRPALGNLARLLGSLQRHADAAPLLARLARLETEPPFLHFDLGRAALLAGNFASAREHLLREIKRDPDYHEFHYWLALALAGLGDAAGAQEQLVLARNNSTTRRDQALYAGKLERLQSMRRTN